jgi:hypothetical protein
VKLTAQNVTPVTKCKNEEYWIHYVLRPMFRVFGRFVMFDTGSTDETKNIAKETAKLYGGELVLIEQDYDDPHAIGNTVNILRATCPTHWMLLVDGDEIWPLEQVLALLEQEIPDDHLVGMVTGRNLAHVDGKLVERDGFSADRLFAPPVRWDKRTDYPFESHDLEAKVEAGLATYMSLHFWHVRHLKRSSDDEGAYFRAEKRAYFPYNGPYKPLPENWLGGELGPYPNPYLEQK